MRRGPYLQQPVAAAKPVRTYYTEVLRTILYSKYYYMKSMAGVERRSAELRVPASRLLALGYGVLRTPYILGQREFEFQFDHIRSKVLITNKLKRNIPGFCVFQPLPILPDRYYACVPEAKLQSIPC